MEIVIKFSLKEEDIKKFMKENKMRREEVLEVIIGLKEDIENDYSLLLDRFDVFNF